MLETGETGKQGHVSTCHSMNLSRGGMATKFLLPEKEEETEHRNNLVGREKV